MAVSAPALTKGVAFKLIFTSTATAGQGANTPNAVKVSVTLPVSPEGGVKLAFRLLAFG